MASTPKNPLNGGGSKQGAPNMTLKPTVPAYDGGQFARDSMTPEEIMVYRDQYWDEMTTDRTMHANATPEHSNPTYTGRQFSDDWDGGYSKYGVSISDKGASKESVEVNPNTANRGKES